MSEEEYPTYPTEEWAGSPISKPKKESGNYVFPKKVGSAMSKISPRTQYEASMMAMTFIMFGLLITTIYIWFTDVSLFLKIFTTFNSICGFVFLSSFLVTTFQQYQSFLMAMGIMEDKNE
jgi:cellulose synthase/poly-beta-1,6-N-acetylglucosamine synthase-like glycosyltransferase